LVFLHEKHFEPVRGMTLDAAQSLRIAALACLPILELGMDAYRGFASVVVHPDEFIVRDREYEDEDGVVHTGDDVLSGESWEQGPVVLAWSEVEASGRGEGYNVVVHEFVHKLDMLSGEADGVPPLHSGMRVPEWVAAFDAAYEDLVAQLERGMDPWLDPYAAEDPAEFFAVCAEMFFDLPERFRQEYPDVYVQLARFFKQDPAGG
jgi:Mlc titration factor MtfA (ptsG expression regulator)